MNDSRKTESKFITLSSGDKIKVVYNRQYGPTCVLLHGFGEAGYYWEIFEKLVSQKYSTLTLDFLGHGESTWRKDGNYKIDQFAVAVAEVLSALKIRRPCLIGHSMGGGVALKVSEAAPDSVACLGLVDSGPAAVEQQDKIIEMIFLSEHKEYPTVQNYANHLKKTRHLVEAKFLESYASKATTLGKDGICRLRSDPRITSLLQMEGQEEWWWTKLPLINCPVMITRGIGSAMLSDQVARRMLSLLRHAEYRTIPLSGHGIPIDNPQGLWLALKPFLEQNLS